MREAGFQNLRYQKQVNQMNTRHLLLAFVLLGLAVCADAGEQRMEKNIAVGVVFDGPSQTTMAFFEQVKAEILALAGAEFTIDFPAATSITADWTAAGIDAALSRLLADSDVDIVLTFGPLASDRAARRETFVKPVIAPFIIDPQLQGIPVAGDTSGRHNFNYISAFARIVDDVKLLSTMVKGDSIALCIQRVAMTTVPDFETTIAAHATRLGISIHILPADTRAEEILAALPADVDAVFVTKLFRFDSAELKTLADGLAQRKLPSLTMGGADEVALGFMASNAAATDYPRLARRIALNVQRILLGEEAGDLGISFAQGRQFTINMATCRAIGYSPTWEMLADAEVLNERPAADRSYDLAAAMRTAVENNPQIAVARHTIASGEADIDLARSNFLPQIDVAATALMLDNDRAAASLGSNPEKQLVGKATFRQLIYDEQANANLDIQNRLLETKTADLEKVKLDIALDAGVAYLNVLRAKAVESIYRDHLRLTRANLELARVREQVGAGGRIDVYRWESQVATAANDLNRARTDRSLAEMQLNRLLDRPLEEPFDTSDERAGVDSLLPREHALITYTDTPTAFAHLRDYLALTGLDNAPELAALDAAIAAQKRAVRSAEAAFWSPTVALQATLEQRMYEGGAGTDGIEFDLGPLAGLVDIEFPHKPDSTNWNVGVNASFNLWDGRGKSTRVTKAGEELAILTARRAVIREQLAQAIRSAAQNAGSAWTSIGLAQRAARAAHQGLDLVTDAYGRGVVTILDLLDAQNTALTADQLAANAVYNFAIELLRTERAAGRLVAFMDDAAWNTWFDGFKSWQRAAETAR